MENLVYQVYIVGNTIEINKKNGMSQKWISISRILMLDEIL